MHINNINRQIEKNFSRFAKDHIAAYPGLNKMPEFPIDIWEKMAHHRMFGIGITQAYGGQDGTWQEISMAATALAEYGGCLGIVLSFLIHEIVACGCVQAFGTDEQKEKFLPDLVAEQREDGGFGAGHRRPSQIH